MLTLLRTLSLGYFSRHRIRSILVILSIALGVATLVGTQALSRGIKTGVQQGVNPLAGLADLLINNGETGVPADLARLLREQNLAGIESVTPLVMWRVGVVELSRPVWLLGVEWPRGKERERLPGDDNLLGVTIHQTYQPRTWLEKLSLAVAPPVLVTENLARELEAKSPNVHRFHLRNAGRKPEVTRMGTVTFETSSLPLKDSAVVVMDLHSASAVCFPEKPGYIHQIGIKVAEGASIESVREEVRTWLGDRADIETIAASRQLVSDVTAGLEIGFAIGGAGALVVGLFLVYNALSVSVAERRHDIGILRSVGATRIQIATLFVLESLVMGLLGSGMGLPLGWLLARAAIRPMATTVSELIVPIDSPQVTLGPWLVLIGLLSGTLVAILAALVPAVQAAGEEPADAVRRVPRRNILLLAVLQIAASVILLLSGFALASFRQQLPARAGMFAGVVCLVLGGLVCTPLMALLVGRFVQPFFRYFFGLEGRLAADNLVRSPGRTGLVIAALAATGGLMVQTAGFLKSTRVAIYNWVEEKIAADLFLTSGSAITTGGSAVTMREDFQKELEKVPGIEVALPVRFLQIEYYTRHDRKKHIVYMVALDTRAFEKVGESRPLAKSLKERGGLQEKGSVLVSENFAALHRVKVGDTITIPVQGRQALEVRVAGLATDYTWNRGTIFMDRAWFREVFGDHQVSIFDVFLEPGADVEKVKQELDRRFGEEEALVVLERSDIHADVHRTLQRVYGLAYAQQSVVGMVALLGVVSALFISVLQRRRELGLLRAVGASRAQILRSVLAEAILMGLVGAVIGFGVGLMLEWYVLEILLLDESGFSFPLRIPWVEAGVVFAASIFFATLAGLWPAYLATRLRIPEAIAYE